MINFDVFEKEVKEGQIKKGYIFCGQDEELIKESINEIVKLEIQEDFKELNLIKLDGMTVNFEDIMNACETMPFMSEKKAVIVYRANFLMDKTDSEGQKLFEKIKEYSENLAPHTIFIMYYLLSDKRERPAKNMKLRALEKNIEVVFLDKLKRDRLLRKAAEVFEERGVTINRMELAYFCNRIDNNFEIIKSEADKLAAYCNGRQVKKEDIDIMTENSNDDDVFDIVELVAEKRIDQAIDAVKEVLANSKQHYALITSLERHFQRLYEIKNGMLKGKKASDFQKDYKIPEFICQKLMKQTAKFTAKQIYGILKLCVQCDTTLKSTTVDKNMEIEFLLINTLTVAK